MSHPQTSTGASPSTPPDRLSTTLVQGGATIIAVIGMTAVVYAMVTLKGREFGDFSRDVSQVLEGPWWTGYYANLLIVVWLTAATTSIFSGLALYRARRSEPARLLLACGFLTAFMVLDDFFMLHDDAYPAAFGVPEEVPYVIYALATLAVGWRFRHRLGSAILLLAGAWLFWGISVALDVFLYEDAPYVLEDGAKAVGVGLWTVLVVRLAFVELEHALCTMLGVSRHRGRYHADHRRDRVTD